MDSRMIMHTDNAHDAQNASDVTANTTQEESLSCIKFDLPYPNKISMNSYWKLNKKTQHLYLNPCVRRFRIEVCKIVRQFTSFGSKPLTISLKMYPPDNRQRDIDNVLKAIIDSLQYAELFDNDSQINKLVIEKFPKSEEKVGGIIEVMLELF